MSGTRHRSAEPEASEIVAGLKGALEETLSKAEAKAAASACAAFASAAAVSVDAPCVARVRAAGARIIGKTRCLLYIR